MDRNVTIVTDMNGSKFVLIKDIIFKGRRSIDWDEVKKYLKSYVGDFFEVAETKDIIYIGRELPDEYTSSKYTYSLKGTAAKAKANVVQGIPELLEIAVGKHFRDNQKDKHRYDAKFGWYRYDSRFALPIYDTNGNFEHYNAFHASMLIRHDIDGKFYLYDIIDIKKETSNPF